ncbi:MAG: hypothetical protein IJT50_03620 [Lentisphaeria bacterium]|nr:hypothetical protein [Lentisphaeria bacterium]
MKLEFRIDWGYQFLYSRRHYHPVFRWDGNLTVSGGKLEKICRLAYPVIWYGPGQCAVETPLPGNSWESSTKRGMAGIRVEAEGDENTQFFLHTCSGDLSFIARELLEKGRIVRHVGPKFLPCHVIVTRKNFYWFHRNALPGEKLWEADDLTCVPVRDWARMRTAWIAPGQGLSFTASVPDTGADFQESLLHVTAMAAPAYTPGAEKQMHDIFPVTLLCDGRVVAELKWFFREHDGFMQMLEDLWMRFPCAPGEHTFELRNGHDEGFILVNRISLRRSSYRHLQFTLPRWVLAGEPMTGRIFSCSEGPCRITWPGGGCDLALKQGWNHFNFCLKEPGVNVEFRAENSRGTVEEVYALPEEDPPVTVGYDMTVVPHDDSGFMDWLLDYTDRTRLGNLVVFRSFLYAIKARRKAMSAEDAKVAAWGASRHRPVAPELLERWGDFCRTHHIHVEAATDFDDGVLVRAAGEMFHSAGRHEWPGAVYAFDPDEQWGSGDMKEAMEHYLAYLKPEIDRAKKVGRSAFGDASGGHRYCYLAGVDFLRTETMVPHTQHLCSQARPAAEALGSGEWGVHIAIQHAVQPYFENHLGLYYLSLFQPWMMGASMIYEEDSLFLMFKEERQAWDDALTKGKRDMTRAFFKFMKTHPRKGQVLRNIAFLEGRYAAPFNGFICGSEQTPDYSVWGRFGNPAPEWGHRQPEKCRQILDVLMPGASTHPLRQRFDRRRFFFSGTPYGDFDEVPVEADASYFTRYKLLLNLGWNTMIPEDFAKLKGFVEQGGILFTGLPQFSTHVKRDFLRDMEDLALWNGGDLKELCGIAVKGRSGTAYRDRFNSGLDLSDVELSAQPSASPEEDGPCFIADIDLAGAEVVVWDADSGLPLVVKYDLGKGSVYTLTAWAYPGHEKLQRLSASVTAFLAGNCQGEYHVVDPSGEVFWNFRKEENCLRLNMLNTDWSVKGNVKQVTVVTPELRVSVTVEERQAALFTVLPFALVSCGLDHFIEVDACDSDTARLTVHGPGPTELRIIRRRNDCETLTLPDDGRMARQVEIRRRK